VLRERFAARYDLKDQAVAVIIYPEREVEHLCLCRVRSLAAPHGVLL
jgi:hypothetical protein